MVEQSHTSCGGMYDIARKRHPLALLKSFSDCFLFGGKANPASSIHRRMQLSFFASPSASWRSCRAMTYAQRCNEGSHRAAKQTKCCFLAIATHAKLRTEGSYEARSSTDNRLRLERSKHYFEDSLRQTGPRGILCRAPRYVVEHEGVRS